LNGSQNSSSTNTNCAGIILLFLYLTACRRNSYNGNRSLVIN